jgi:hypothetical protein
LVAVGVVLLHLMEKFGNHCGLCKELAFETVILIDEEDLK